MEKPAPGRAGAQNARPEPALLQDSGDHRTAGSCPGSRCPPGQSEALFDAGRHRSSKPPPLCLASMDDLFQHATPACFAASLQVLYCLWPGLATSLHPAPAALRACRWGL